MSGILYLVATPIGNLGDISRRAAETLANVDFIAAEDTRVTLNLLRYLELRKPLVSYYEHNSRESGSKIVARLLDGENCALVTDAGMPAISDPGEDLVRLCIESGVTVTAVPGPCAAVTAVSLSGLPSGRFTFEGFLSTARKSRFEHLNELRREKRTMIFYEAPHKLRRTLADMLETFGDRRISLSRELTKFYEETLRFTLSDAVAYFDENPPRGEFVLVVEGFCEESQEGISLVDGVNAALALIEGGQTVKDSVKQTAHETGLAKNALYNAVVEEIKKTSPPTHGRDDNDS